MTRDIVKFYATFTLGRNANHEPHQAAVSRLSPEAAAQATSTRTANVYLLCRNRKQPKSVFYEQCLIMVGPKRMRRSSICQRKVTHDIQQKIHSDAHHDLDSS